jgi:hypothetical protein
MFTMGRSSLHFEPSNLGKPFAKNAKHFFGRGLGELVPDAILHETKRAIAKGEAFAEALVRRHAAGAFDLFAGAGVHCGDL